MQRMMGLVRRCIEDYRMIEPGDRIAVGVSGGKDSLTLLTLLAALREYVPYSYDLTAITIDMGLGGMDFSPVARLCERLGVPYSRVETEIGPIIFEHRKENNPCSLCAKMRRGALNQALLEQGFSKVALGHHYDDAVETFLMSLLFEGRIGCFEPVTYLDRTGVTQIRPMLYLTEGMVRTFAAEHDLPVVHNPCPVFVDDDDYWKTGFYTIRARLTSTRSGRRSRSSSPCCRRRTPISKRVYSARCSACRCRSGA